MGRALSSIPRVRVLPRDRWFLLRIPLSSRLHHPRRCIEGTIQTPTTLQLSDAEVDTLHGVVDEHLKYLDRPQKVRDPAKTREVLAWAKAHLEWARKAGKEHKGTDSATNAEALTYDLERLVERAEINVDRDTPPEQWTLEQRIRMEEAPDFKTTAEADKYLAELYSIWEIGGREPPDAEYSG